jgi:hypothetical protein
MFSYAASINTITVSIHAPKDKIREKFVRKLSVKPNDLRTINVIKNDNIIPRVDIRDCLSHINSVVIANTSNIEVIALDHKDL